MSGGEFVVTRSDSDRESDEDIVAAAGVDDEWFWECFGHRSATPDEVVIAVRRGDPPRLRHARFHARTAAGVVVGTAGLWFDPEREENRDRAWLKLYVTPATRRGGLGRLLFECVAGHAREVGRPVLVAETFDRTDCAGFAEAVGGAAKSWGQVNRLAVVDTDRPLLGRWMSDGPRRAPDYEVFSFDGPVPDDLVEPWAELRGVMNDAPRDELAEEDESVTVDDVIEFDDIMTRQQAVVWTVAARHRATGALVGYHNLIWRPYQPTLMFVGDTGVRREHRGHAIGKWLKATLMLRVLDERPTVTHVNTGNATSNAPMRAINQQMGYRPVDRFTVWELDLSAR